MADALAFAPTVREVEIPGCSAEDYRAARLWCPECAAEPYREVRCATCPEVHREGMYGPYLTCNACGSELVWVVLDRPTQREARSLPALRSVSYFGRHLEQDQ